MNDYNTIKLLLKSAIDVTYRDREPFSVTSEEIREVVLTTAKNLPPLMNISIEALNVYCRDLETMYDISQDYGYSVKASNYKPWLDERRTEIDFHYWNRFNAYLKHEDEIPSQIISVLDDVSDEILDFLGDPMTEGSWHRKGMVVGQVQSGKTTNYSSVICKAADAGYKIIILLTGIQTLLENKLKKD